MSSTLSNIDVTADQSVVAIYKNHIDAEAAVRLLAADGIRLTTISIIGRNYETHEEVQGFYHPADAALSGAGQGAWFGGVFGLMMGAFGFFVFPALGSIIVLGPLSGMIAGAIGGAGLGAVINALVAAGVPKNQALKYQARLQAGEFLVLVQGDNVETTRAQEILHATPQTHLQTHSLTLEEDAADLPSWNQVA